MNHGTSNATRRRAGTGGPAGAAHRRRMPLLAFIVFAGFLPLLALAPYLVPLDPDVSSAASVAGYNTSVAYLVAVAWIVVATVAIALLARGPWRSRSSPDAALSTAHDESPKTAEPGWPPILLLVGVGILVFMVYNPTFLARAGPFIEEEIHLGALHKMLGGQQPYRDFEFLYGPLMLYIPWGWTRLFGYGLPSLYAYVAILEAASFVVLTMLVWKLVGDRRRRILALLVLAALAFNALVGPNWSVSRRLPALIAFVVLASNPLRMRNVLATAGILAVQAAWSHDFGAAAMIGSLGILALAAWHRSPAAALRAAIVLVVTTCVLWASLVWALLGDGFGDYLGEVSYLTSRFSAGEAGFEFYWTVNSAAVFLLIAFACVIVGRRLFARRELEPGTADYVLIAACGFLLVTMKSGLNRSDLWHLDATVFPLVLAMLAPATRRIFTVSPGEQRMVGATAGVIAFTYAFGLLPSVSMLAQGWWRGLSEGERVAYDMPVPDTAAPTVNLAYLPPDSPARRLAAYFADPARRGRPVVFYADTWTLPYVIGVYKTDFINDDFLYGDDRGDRVRAYIEAQPDAFVIMTGPVYDRLVGLADPHAFPEHTRRFRPTTAKRIADWLSTVHYRGLEAEIPVKDARWRRTVGNHVRERFVVAARFDQFIVLERHGT